MPDNSKGELIKKKIVTPTPPPKKKLIIKKVVIKKQAELPAEKVIQKNEKFDRNDRNDKNKNKFFEKKTFKPENERFPHKKIIYKKAPGILDKSYEGKKFYKRDITDKNKKTDFTSTLKLNEKDRSRKKQIKKQETYNKKDDKREELNKAFQLRRQKAKDLLSAVPAQIDIIDIISISDLSKKMNIKASVLISKLMELGTMVTITDTIDAETAEIVCSEFNCKVNIVSLYDQTIIEEEKEEDEDLKPRPPIVTVMGHVDHGKTKLLDTIRSTNVIDGESGGITQHIGAYSVVLKNGHKITFIDTPGHEAFTTMRARGANITDIVILVVAADDGVMPQTIEAINHAKEAKVPIIVAINKIDKENINIDKIKQQLTDYNLLPEDWGGHTLYCEISALKNIGIDNLLDTIILQAEMLDLKASYKIRAKGFVLESKIDPGRGAVITVIILKGILKIGDFFVAGVYCGKVRALYSDKGEKIKEAGPSTSVEITGIEKSPKAGDPFNVVASEKEAKIISVKRQELNRMEEAKSVKKVTLKDLLAKKPNEEIQELKIIIKADVHGSVEALKDSLEKLSNKEIKITTVSSNVGAINESDVMLAVASKAIIIGFHVRPNPKAAELAEKEKIEIRRYNIIYDVIEDIKASITGMIKPDLIEELLGNIEVKQIFKISKIGTVAGCVVTSGKVKRNSLIRLMRDDVVIYSGKITTLKRFKDEVSEVTEGSECGISIENYKDIKVGDIMEAYEIKEIARNISDIK